MTQVKDQAVGVLNGYETGLRSNQSDVILLTQRKCLCVSLKIILIKDFGTDIGKKYMHCRVWLAISEF